MTQSAITPRRPLPPAEGADPATSPAFGRAVLRAARSAALATLDAGSGFPFASIVNIATDADGAPLMLLSTVALHTRNIMADPRVSLMLTPLTADAAPRMGAAGGGRLTVTGRALRQPDPNALRRFLACQPKMTLPSTLPSFELWRVEPAAADLLGGPGLLAALGAKDLLTDLTGAEALVAGEAALLRDLNTAHAARLRAMAEAKGGEAGPWRATGLDPDGVDLRLGGQALRLALPNRVTTAAGFLAALG
ncbi:HugZ family protein [Humitalea sp. 24SJ18S-53]|uniref:HugZ family pyridoxamine 5'-phosphate oxidase n=1 Tax=Humitalea sp. 24SJ18S-53 TaxID=3422307 RepID=UPI003D664BFC